MGKRKKCGAGGSAFLTLHAVKKNVREKVFTISNNSGELVDPKQFQRIPISLPALS